MSESKIILQKKSIETVVDENAKYIDDRRHGRITSLKTKYSRLNRFIMGGLETNTIIGISAMSGAGKSTLAKEIRDSIWELNPTMDFNQYLFNFEMVALAQISRSLVTSTGKSMHDLYSVDRPMNDSEFDALNDYYKELKRRKGVFFIETPATAEVIKDSLLEYYVKECRPTGKTMVYEIDHALLTKGEQGDDEKKKIDKLMLALVEVKKKISNIGGSSVGIVLSQMNRNIQSIERIKNKEMHRPQTSDLFGASSIEQCCDYIVFAHMPGKLHLQSYTEKELPTKMEYNGKVVNIPYFELVKNRTGESGLTIPLLNKLDRFSFDEMDKDVFWGLKEMHDEGVKIEYRDE